ncbi:MAG TPA: hypothetical protein VMV60_00440 [Thermoanaerobaculia bacterium]|nr:hypothetical protein [Thermoanaerobaculia bacterium]
MSGAPPRSPAEDRVRLVKRLILACGLAGAVVIWIVNAPPPDAGLDLENSKAYLREMEVVGGTANLLASEFRSWFAGLWHGRTLAYTVAVLTFLAAFVYDFFATPLPPPGESGGGRDVSA